MARFRLAGPAQADLANILATSVERRGSEGQHRYRILLASGMRMIAADPEGPLTHDRKDLLPGLRSFHLRYARGPTPYKVKNPVHVLYYRTAKPGLIEVIRVLHERMDPSRHFNT